MSKLAVKKARWFELIKEQEASGLSQAEFCKQRHLKFHQLHYYRHLLKKENQLSSVRDEAKVVPVEIKSLPPKVSGFQEVRLLFPNGMQCTVPSEMEIKRIGELVEILQSC